MCRCRNIQDFRSLLAAAALQGGYVQPSAGLKTPCLEKKDLMRCEPVEILYEDSALLAAVKPAGLPMHPNLDPSRPNFLDRLRVFLQERDGDCGYLALHQRLDLGTSGVVVLSRSEEANPSLAAQFADHSARKIYLALAASAGHLPHKQWETAYFLAAPAKRGGQVRCRRRLAGKEDDSEFKESRTVFTLLCRRSGLLLLQAELKSGRKHQIRAHLSAQGLPILGDTLYHGADSLSLAGRDVKVERPMLHAAHLELVHPLTGRPLCFRADPPADFQRIAKLAGIDREAWHGI